MPSVYVFMFLALSSFVGLSLGACPKNLVTVPIDPVFVSKNQPADGWYMPWHSQISKEQLFGLKQKPAPKPAEGSKKMCITINILVKGSPAPITVAYTCTYKETISEQVCSQKFAPDGAPTLPGAPAGAPTLPGAPGGTPPLPGGTPPLPGAPAGVPSTPSASLPQSFTIQFVKTDNKKYAAYGACLNDEQFVWGVLATSEAALDEPTKKEILAALHIEKEDEKRDDTLNYGQIGTKDGDCPAVPSAPKIKPPNPADAAKGGLPKFDPPAATTPKIDAGKGLPGLPGAGGLGGGLGK